MVTKYREEGNPKEEYKRLKALSWQWVNSETVKALEANCKILLEALDPPE